MSFHFARDTALSTNLAGTGVNSSNNIVKRSLSGIATFGHYPSQQCVGQACRLCRFTLCIAIAFTQLFLLIAGGFHFSSRMAGLGQ